MKRTPYQFILKGLSSILLAVTLAACGGGGITSGNSVTSKGTARALSPEFSARKAVAYSPYRTSNRDTETVSKANIKQDLDLLLQGNFKLLRLFDSSDKVSKQLLEVITENQMDIKVMLGIYVQSGNEAFSQQEIARGVALANAYKDIILAVSVGNETMVSWSFNKIPVSTMATYIKSVRDQISQPVTTDDNWAFYASAPSAITDILDFAAVHTYPLADTLYPVNGVDLWNWKQADVPAASRATAMMDAAIASAKNEYTKVRNHLNAKGLNAMPIVIGETGWKAEASDGEVQRAHPVNQKMYFDRLKAWSSGPSNIFYFEAFDEPWKQGDDKWGMFNVNRKARYMVQDLYPANIWETPAYTAADAVYYKPSTINNAVTSSNYVVFHATGITGASPVAATSWNAWDCAPCSAVGVIAADGSLTITPSPKAWGWGFFNGLDGTAGTAAGSENLSNFNVATGKLNFKVKTTYPGSIRIGLQAYDTSGLNLIDVFMSVAPGQFGYNNDGNWHDVAVPITTLLGTVTGNMPDMRQVHVPFVINDVYAQTGKANNANITTPISIDAVYWSK